VIEFIIYTIKIAKKKMRNMYKIGIQKSKYLKIKIKKNKNNVCFVIASIDLYNICLNVPTFQRCMYFLAIVA
jgi:hypothetical protein